MEMDFLTTNFRDDSTARFTAPFRLLDLPLELLFKVLVFLDEPEMRALSQTCHYLRDVARERYIMRSKFFYVRNRIGIRITDLRPALSELYAQHIIPVQNISLLGNTSHVLVLNQLQKSFRRDSLSKELQKRPKISELKEKNIIPVDSATSPLVKSKVKELKRENLSQMLQTLMKSYRFQKKITKSDVDSSIKAGAAGHLSSTISPAEQKELITKIEKIEKRARNNEQEKYVDVSEEFVRIYNKLCSRLGNALSTPTPRRTVSMPTHSSSQSMATDTPTSPKRPTQANVLNHIDESNPPRTPIQSRVTSSSSCFSQDAMSPEMTEEIENFPSKPPRELSSVLSKKQYFEKLASQELKTDPRADVLRRVDRSVSDSGHTLNNRPSRTVLRASVVGDSLISYEKLF